VTSFYALFFRYLQGAAFYRGLYREAVDLLPPGEGRLWLDAGCGPGLLPRLAAARGYLATGIDPTPSMIHEARRAGRGHEGNPRFETADLDSHARVASGTYDVVSAASLLAVVSDTGSAVRTLWSMVKPGGSLLVIEPTALFTEAHARALLQRRGIGRRGFLLIRWGRAREGRAVDLAPLRNLTAEPPVVHSFLDGMVESWLVRKPSGRAR
jgi:SAM-dependent methyltransferase